MRKSFGGFKDKIVTQTHLNKLCLGKERNQANQKHKTLEILLY